MKIVSIGGGPAGLYTAILVRKAFPEAEVVVYERNRADDTFGWGVVFSDETLDAFARADRESHDRIKAEFRYWRDIETFYGGEKIVSTGHGFAALSRKKLLEILQGRCAELGVEMHFEQAIESLDDLSDADLILGADGVNSWVRAELAEHFQPDLDWRKCRFTWLGTDMPLDAFTFIFEPTEWGLFQVHAYPFEDGLGTFIVECREETWRKAGLENASEDDTVRFCESLFAPYLDGHRLFTNRSIWRKFPTVRCATWSLAQGKGRNVVLLGDAAHTAHFSIGSGTKLAMEDAIALVEELRLHGAAASGIDMAKVLHEYEENRWVDVAKLQKAAQTSLEWFENSERYMGQDPVQFTFNLMTRSKRITYDNLLDRDPALVHAAAREFRLRELGAGADLSDVPPPMFTPMRLRGLELKNRIVVSPMCQYSARDGEVGDWHLVHLGSRAIGGAGLVITEMTDVSSQGRITLGCAGMYDRAHVGAWKQIVGFVHERSGAKIGIQLAHAGRKGSMSHPWLADDQPLTAAQGAWQTLAPSALPFKSHWQVPKAMDRTDMERVKEAFVNATRWSMEAGFDLVELHMAHGYLLSSFLSPLTNVRTDIYGGSLENRMRYPLEVFSAVRAVWPRDRPVSVRVSATDWLDDEGTTIEETVVLSKQLKELGCDVIDVSTAGNVPESVPEYGRMYQVPFAEQVRHEAGLPVMAVGAILGADHANTVLTAGRADLIAMARPHLRDPYLTLHAAEHYERWDAAWPGQYLRAKPAPDRGHQRKSDPR